MTDEAREIVERLRGEPVGWTIVGRAESGVVVIITEGYSRRDKADLDCEWMNGVNDGVVYTVHPVGPAVGVKP